MAGKSHQNHLAKQPFDISEPLRFVRVSDGTVALQLGDPNVHLGGPFVAITKGILSIAGINVNSEARDALKEAIDPTKLQVSIPEQYSKLNPRVEAASFESVGNQLDADIVFDAQVPAAEINEFIAQLVAQLQKMKATPGTGRP